VKVEVEVETATRGTCEDEDNNSNRYLHPHRLLVLQQGCNNPDTPDPEYRNYHLLYSIRRLRSQIHEFDIAGKWVRTVILYCLVLICFDIHSDCLFAEHSVNF